MSNWQFREFTNINYNSVSGEMCNMSELANIQIMVFQSKSRYLRMFYFEKRQQSENIYC